MIPSNWKFNLLKIIFKDIDVNKFAFVKSAFYYKSLCQMYTYFCVAHISIRYTYWLKIFWMQFCIYCMTFKNQLEHVYVI